MLDGRAAIRRQAGPEQLKLRNATIQRAGLEDLMKTPGVNAATARTVYAYFQNGG